MKVTCISSGHQKPSQMAEYKVRYESGLAIELIDFAPLRTCSMPCFWRRKVLLVERLCCLFPTRLCLKKLISHYNYLVKNIGIIHHNHSAFDFCNCSRFYQICVIRISIFIQFEILNKTDGNLIHHNSGISLPHFVNLA